MKLFFAFLVFSLLLIAGCVQPQQPIGEAAGYKPPKSKLKCSDGTPVGDCVKKSPPRTVA